MADLREQLERLRLLLEALPSSATASEIAQLESEARALLAQSKNTQYEAEARELFTQLARHSAPPTPEAATIRGLLRRARIRIEIAGSEDDIDEAIDILAEALDLGMRVASDETLMRKVAEERLAALTRAGVPPEEIDHRAREALARHAPATPWFGEEAFADGVGGAGELEDEEVGARRREVRRRRDVDG